jgi:F-type H+-transporting ATPase subunit alpha
MRSVAGSLRLELAQYRNLEAFAQFGSDLDKASQDQLNRGKRWVEVLKQGQYSPIPVEKQVAIIFAGGNGFLDDVAVEDIRRFEAELYQFLDNSKPEVLQLIREKRELTDEIKQQLKDALKEFKEQRFRKTTDQKAAKPKAAAKAEPANENRTSAQATSNGNALRAADEARETPAQV